MALVDFDLKVPPQSAPYSDAPPQSGVALAGGAFGGVSKGRIFNILWWKFFQDIVDQIRAISGGVAGDLPFVTPEEFDAVGDGVTNDTTAVQAAFNSGKAVIMREQAIYACSSLTWPTGLVIFGMPGSTLRQLPGTAANDTPFISSVSQSRIWVQGISVDGNRGNQPGVVGATGIYFEDPEDVVLRDVKVFATSGDGIGGIGWRDVLVDHPTVSDWGNGNAYAGIYHRFTGTRDAANIEIRSPEMDGTASGSCIKITAATACPLTGVKVLGGNVKAGYPTSGFTDALAVECFSDGDGNFVSDVLVDGVTIDSELAPATSYGKSWGVSLSQVLRGTVSNCNISNTGYFFIELIGSQLTAHDNHGYNVGVLTGIVSSVMTGDQAYLDIHDNTSVTRAGAQPSSVLAGIQIYIEGTANLANVNIHDNVLVIQGAQYGVWVQNNGGADLSLLKEYKNQVYGDGTAGSFAYITENDGAGAILAPQYIHNSGQNVDVFFQRSAGITDARIIENFPNLSTIGTVYAGTPGVGEMIIDIANTEGTNFAPPGIQMRGRVAPVITGNGRIYLDQADDTCHFGTVAPGVDSNPNILYINRVNFGSPIQGVVFSFNSYFVGAGAPNPWLIASDGSVSTRAGYLIGAAEAIRMGFNNATNSQIGDPAIIAFQVLDSDAVYTGAGYPLEIETSGSRIFAGAGSPNTVVTANPGSLYLDTTGPIYNKATGTGNTGWVVISTGTGVASLNALTGALSITSPNSTVDINPTGSDIELEMVPLTTHAAASGQLTTTTGFQDIPNCSVTLNRAGTWLIRCAVEAVPGTGDGDTTVQLVVNGSAQSVFARSNAANFTVMLGQEWRVTSVTSGWVAKLQAKKNTSGGGGSFIDVNSTITAEWAGF